VAGDESHSVVTVTGAPGAREGDRRSGADNSEARTPRPSPCPLLLFSMKQDVSLSTFLSLFHLSPLLSLFLKSQALFRSDTPLQ